MGQAFDRDGNVLGEAFGETKREVFDKLTEEFKDAAEIRIRSLEQQASAEKPGARDELTAQQALDRRDRMMQFFAYAHLPARLQAASMPFCELAEQIVGTLPSNPERTVALRKLLEAKDAAVRAVLYQP